MTDTPASGHWASGHCLCGSVCFEIRGKPVWVGHCHCQSCRRNTGSAVATFVGLRSAQVTYTAGERHFFDDFLKLVTLV